MHWLIFNLLTLFVLFVSIPSEGQNSKLKFGEINMDEIKYNKCDFDPDAEKLGIVKHHLAGAIFSLLCVLQTLEKHPHLDDRFFINTKPIGEDDQNANQNK